MRTCDVAREAVEGEGALPVNRSSALWRGVGKVGHSARHAGADGIAKGWLLAVLKALETGPAGVGHRRAGLASRLLAVAAQPAWLQSTSCCGEKRGGENAMRSKTLEKERKRGCVYCAIRFERTATATSAEGERGGGGGWKREAFSSTTLLQSAGMPLV